MASLFQRITGFGVNMLPEKGKNFMVSKNADLIAHIKNPSEALQMMAINQKPSVINGIKNPCLNARWTAVSSEPTLIIHMKNPDERTQHVAIKRNPELIKNLKSPCPNAQKQAVAQKPQLITSIKEPCDDALKIVFDSGRVDLIKGLHLDEKQRGMLIGHSLEFLPLIKNPSKGDLFTSIQHHENTLHYVTNPPEWLVEMSVDYYPQSIKWVQNPTYDLQKKAVMGMSVAIREIANPTDELRGISSITKLCEVYRDNLEEFEQLDLSASEQQALLDRGRYQDIYGHFKNPAPEIAQKLVGLVKYSEVETEYFFDKEQYVRVVKEQDHYKGFNGFSFETFTDDQSVKQQTDALYDDALYEIEQKCTNDYEMEM